jgi:hypothetical protein
MQSPANHALLNVTMPDNEIVRPNSTIRAPKPADAVKQWISAGKALSHLLLDNPRHHPRHRGYE